LNPSHRGYDAPIADEINRLAAHPEFACTGLPTPPLMN
jgi:hypothetical protein